jgi:hypothetical protein
MDTPPASNSIVPLPYQLAQTGTKSGKKLYHNCEDNPTQEEEAKAYEKMKANRKPDSRHKPASRSGTT